MIPDRTWIKELVKEKGRDREALVPILLAVQRKYNYLPEEVLKIISLETEISPADIRAVSTFYKRFRLRPAGKHTIRVCIGTACHVKGGDRVAESFCKDLNIPEGEDTDADKMFTVEKVACLGCCMLAVAVQIDEVMYGWVKPGKTRGVIEDFLVSHTGKDGSGHHEPAGEVSSEVRICLCSSCQAAGADKVYQEIKRCADRYKLSVRPLDVGCTGMSYSTPLIQIIDSYNRLFNYACVEPAAVETILLHHFKPRSPSNFIDRLLTTETDPIMRYRMDALTSGGAGWVDKQVRIATEHGGELPPLDINAYMSKRGFEGFKKALTFTPEEVAGAVVASGLRGRGGAGFPTGVKWQNVQKARDEKKFIVCNADEGDPGAFMDRMLLESFPFRIIEGMLIAAKATGADSGYIFVRDEYPLAVDRIRKAIHICIEEKLLGKNILGSGIDLSVKVVEGAGAFVCGEETALTESMEGKRAIPRIRPPYPSQKGFRGRPTLINNVETFASVPWIFVNGPDAFGALGTKGSPGTKTFALAGKIKRGGLVEVPLGMTLSQIIEEVGGGIPGGRALKAVQIGGPSGGCIPAEMTDYPIDYETLSSAGSMMGSGGMVVLDEDDCIVDIARYFLSFTVLESCGKCTFCRIGSKRMLEVIERICLGEGKQGDIEKLYELSDLIKRGSLCGLGKTAPNPVISTLRSFRHEYEEHLKKRCPAGKCANLFSFTAGDKCNGCMLCARGCPVGAIDFKPWEKAVIDPEKCIRCGVCRNECPLKAIEVSE